MQATAATVKTKASPEVKTYPRLVITLSTKAGVSLTKAKKLWDSIVDKVADANPKMPKDAMFYGICTNQFKTQLGLPVTPVPEEGKPGFPAIVMTGVRDDVIINALPVEMRKKLWITAAKEIDKLGLPDGSSKKFAYTTVAFKTKCHYTILSATFPPEESSFKGAKLKKMVKLFSDTFTVPVADISRYIDETKEQLKDSDYNTSTPANARKYYEYLLQKVLQRAEFKKKKLAREEANAFLVEGALSPTQNIYLLLKAFDEDIMTVLNATNFSKGEDSSLQFDCKGDSFTGQVVVTPKDNGKYSIKFNKSTDSATENVISVDDVAGSDLVPAISNVVM